MEIILGLFTTLAIVATFIALGSLRQWRLLRRTGGAFDSVESIVPAFAVGIYRGRRFRIEIERKRKTSSMTIYAAAPTTLAFKARRIANDDADFETATPDRLRELLCNPQFEQSVHALLAVAISIEVRGAFIAQYAPFRRSLVEPEKLRVAFQQIDAALCGLETETARTGATAEAIQQARQRVESSLLAARIA